MQEMINPLDLAFFVNWKAFIVSITPRLKVVSWFETCTVQGTQESSSWSPALHSTYNLIPFTWLPSQLFFWDLILKLFLFTSDGGESLVIFSSQPQRIQAKLGQVKILILKTIHMLVVFQSISSKASSLQFLQHQCCFYWIISSSDHFFLIWSNFLFIEMLKLLLCRMFVSPVTLLVVVSREFAWFSCFFRIKSSISGVMIVFQEARS